MNKLKKIEIFFTDEAPSRWSNGLAPLILIGASWSMAQIDRLIEPDNLRP